MAARERRTKGPKVNWKPRPETVALLADVQAILDEADRDGVLPLSVRAVFYRLVGLGRYPKSAKFAASVSGHLSEARRAGLVPWYAIYDSGETWRGGRGWESAERWLASVKERAEVFRLDRTVGQPRLILWCEAAGLVPLVARAARPFDVRVVSTSGYDSTTVRHRVAEEATEPTEVLHVGDLDYHGQRIYRAMVADVQAWADHYANEVSFTRLAVTPEQVEEFDLPDDPSKPGDVLAEAVPFVVMRDLVTEAIRDRYDLDRYAETLEAEQDARAAVVAALDGVTL
jgi:hypothetical protein